MEQVVPSMCHMCYNRCQIGVHARDGVITRIEGLPGSSIEGMLCPKGNSGIMHVYDPNRIKTPLKRTNPEKGIGVDPRFAEISWDEALTIIANELARVRSHSPFNLRIASMDTYRLFPMSAFAHAFGTPHVGWGAGTAGGVSCGNGVHMLGQVIHGAYVERIDYEHCNYAMLWGCGLGFEAYGSLVYEARRCADARLRGMKLVVVDPRLSAAAAKADEWVPIRPGTDCALALGMINILLNELRIYDAAFIKRQTNGPYLIGPDGYYVRDQSTGKALLWDIAANAAMPYDEASLDLALEGDYQVGGIPCKPAFQLLKERVASYTPEKVAEITTVPPQAVRRLAQQWGAEARIGSTIVIEGKEFPWRPVALAFYRGTQAQKHATMTTFALELLAMIVGAIDVPGSMVRMPMGASRYGRILPLPAGEDGLVEAHTALYHIHVPSGYPPKTNDLKEWFPVSEDESHMLYLTALAPEKFGLSGPMANIIHFSNPVLSMGGLDVVSESLERTFNVVCDTVLSETAGFADVVFPEPTYLERYYVYGCGDPNYLGQVLMQPAIPPLFGLLDFIDTLIELAGRLDILFGVGGMNYWFNTLMGLAKPYELELDKKYKWVQILDLILRNYTGGEHDLEWFRRNGAILRPMGIDKYMPYRTLRLPLYLDFLKKAGDELRKSFVEHGIEEKIGMKWDFTDYEPLPSWKPGPMHENREEYDLFAISYKPVLSPFGRGANNAWLMELLEKDPYALKCWINAGTARKRGIRDGDAIWVQSPAGKVRGIAALAESVHPECVAIGSIFGHWAPHSIAQGKGTHFNSLCAVNFENTDFVSGALANAGTKVKVYRAQPAER